MTDWLHLFVRWLHVFAGILWVGQTYFFTWLDARIHEEGDVWLIHSGGFYVVDRQQVPTLRPKTLHWFRWEALATWLSGMALLVLVYYAGGMLLDSSDISLGLGISVSLGSLVAGWFVYDALWRSSIARNERLATTVSFLLIAAFAYGFSCVFSARAAYVQVGALLGTLMAANVWLRILPAQRQMLAALKAGQPVDPTLGVQAKTRSKHNTYSVVPLVFIMLSNHFPISTYGHDHAWLILSAMVLLGWAAAHFIRRA